MARRAPAVLIALAALTTATPAVGQGIELPRPTVRGDMSVAEALHERQSARDFAETALTEEEIGQLLWAAAGETVDGTSGPTRAPASAGGLYPIRAYIVVGAAEDIDAGVYRYRWRTHSLESVRQGDVRERLRRAALGQAAVGRAPCVLVLAADYDVTRRRYGERGVERYVHMDAGHSAQNVLLQAQALGLGATPIGAFTDVGVRRVLNLDYEPLYLIPVGHPR